MQGWPNAPADLVPQLCRLTDGNPLFLDELLRQLGYREAEQSRGGGGTRSAEPEPDRSDPGARRPARLAAARRRDLPAAGGRRGGPRVRGVGCRRGGRADCRSDSSTPSTGPRSHACSAASARRFLTATPSLTRSYATPSTASSCAGGGCGTTTRSPSPRSGCTPTSWTPTSTSWPTTSTWERPWPTRTRPPTTAVPRASVAPPAGVRGGGGAFRPQLGGGRAVRPLRPRGARCDVLIALAEAQNRAGDTAPANTNFERAATLARSLGDADRLAAAALRAGPLSYLGIVRANEEQVRLLEEALAALPEGKDPHLRAMVTARLGLVIVYGTDVPARRPCDARSPSATTRSPWPGVSETASRSGTRSTRACTPCGMSGRRRSGWRRGRSSARSPTTSATSSSALHGHMWRIRELLAAGRCRRGQRGDRPVPCPRQRAGASARGVVRLQRDGDDGVVGGSVRAGGAARPTGSGGGGGSQRTRAQLLRCADAVDVVAARRPDRARPGVPGGRRADPHRAPHRAGGAGAGPCRGGRCRGVAGPPALAGCARMGERRG